MASPRTPQHKPDPRYELRYYSYCGHVAWGARREPLPDHTPLGTILVGKYLPARNCFCPVCALAEKNPDRDHACLVVSNLEKRITAVGFGKARKDELSALRFQWEPKPGVWFFPVRGRIEDYLPNFEKTLGCKIDYANMTNMPTLPKIKQVNQDAPRYTDKQIDPIATGELGEDKKATDTESKLISIDRNKHDNAKKKPLDQIIFCRPDMKNSLKVDPEASVIIGTISWPPDQSALRNIVGHNLPVGARRVLCLPPLLDLIKLGFTRAMMLKLMAGAAEHDVVVFTVDTLFDLRDALPDVKKVVNALALLPEEIPQAAVKPSLPARKGGRPATARTHKPEVLRLLAGGLSANAVAKSLGISARSVLRFLGEVKDQRPAQ